ncbi:MAG: alpha/beta fold hydrolase, partial [Gemmatimonadales bacterium]
MQNAFKNGKGPASLRLYFTGLSLIAPARAEAQAARLFMTPRLRKAPSPTDLLHERSGSEPEMLDGPTGPIPLWVQGSGPTVLLVHGWQGSAADMVPLGLALAGQGFRAALADMPGHGQSRGGKTSVVQYMKSIGIVTRHLGGIDGIVGHSLGGTAVTLALAEKVVSAKSAVLISPASSPGAFEERFSRFIGLPDRRRPGMRRLLEQIVGRPIESLDAAVAAQGLDIPSVVLHDPDDREVPFSQAGEISRSWSGSRVIPMPDTGHRRILNDPRVLGEVVDFFWKVEN